MNKSQDQVAQCAISPPEIIKPHWHILASMRLATHSCILTFRMCSCFRMPNQITQVNYKNCPNDRLMGAECSCESAPGHCLPSPIQIPPCQLPYTNWIHWLFEVALPLLFSISRYLLSSVSTFLFLCSPTQLLDERLVNKGVSLIQSVSGEERLQWPQSRE